MSKYGKRRLVWVIPFNGSPVRYGFLTNIDQAQGTQLGQTAIGGTVPQGYVFGANSPKPARASKAFASGTVSSFVNAGNIASARQQGWRVGKARLRRGGSRKKSSVVYVTLGGVNYAWTMPNDTKTKIGGDLAALGIKTTTGQETNLVFGASNPTPPKAYKTVGTGSSINLISTFYDPQRSLPAGWQAAATGIDPTRNP
ncbi:hypothetical protein [Almyronema epifaneia]|uniref:Uncharacterized protein n=1 Tax=Almyronema epifaneia S1 TaxID=2991925 RepID=A0ABW6IK14_9CYAN